MRKQKALYFECVNGISGDMTLAALMDLGVSLNVLKDTLGSLNLTGFTIKKKRVTKCGISATHVDVVQNKKTKTLTSLTDIKKIINKSSLNQNVKKMSLAIFDRLAEAEAAAHNVDKNSVHFHEIGALDTIVDIVGCAICLDALKPDVIYASPVALGGGYVTIAHGRFPVPAPAVANMIQGIPIAQSTVEAELATPTGIAILKTVVDTFAPRPAMTVEAVASGAGTHDFKDHPNTLRVFMGTLSQTHPEPEVWMVESTIDDMTGELWGYIFDTLYEHNALDVYLTQVLMKKNRPGVVVSVLVEKDKREEIENLLLRETTTFGVRSYPVTRKMLVRKIETIATDFGKARVKVGSLDGKVITVSPEFEDCRRIAAKHNVPLKSVYQSIMQKAITIKHT